MFFLLNACSKMQVTRPVQNKTNSTIKETIMNNAMRNKRATIKIQISVVQLLSVFCIVVMESLVNSLLVVTSCCDVDGSSVVATPEPINVKEILIKVQQ